MYINLYPHPMFDADSAPGASNGSPDTPDTSAGQDSDAPRVFTQEEVNALISRIKAEGKQKTADAVKAAKAEGERLAKLSAEEAAAEQAKQREADLAAREAAVTARELRAKAAQTLADKGYDASILDVLDYSSEENCTASIDAHIKAIDKAVKAAALRATKGTAPSAGTSSQSAEAALINRIRQAAGLKTT